MKSKKELKQSLKQKTRNAPFSDERIKELLAEGDIHISRRAVAKYRESLYIFNSLKRKVK